MDWQRLRKPQMTLRVMFALTTLVAIVVWYQTRQRFEVIGELSADDFAAIRGLVRSQSEFKRERLVKLRVNEPNHVFAYSRKRISPQTGEGIHARLERVGSKWIVNVVYKETYEFR